ncbi:MAG: hypothetical protein AB7I38_18050 [Dehalococcoidia bacterium]
MDEATRLRALGLTEALARVPGLTKLDKCAALKISPSTWDRWIRAVGYPRPEKLSRLCFLSGMTADQIERGGSFATPGGYGK